jgi:hypothetical protein
MAPLNDERCSFNKLIENITFGKLNDYALEARIK